MLIYLSIYSGAFFYFFCIERYFLQHEILVVPLAAIFGGGAFLTQVVIMNIFLNFYSVYFNSSH